MRIYANCLEAESEIHRDLFEMGIRVHPKTMQDKNIENDPGYATIELSGYSFAIKDTSDKDELIKKRGLNLDWCLADFQERISPDHINPGEAYALRPEWEEFVHDGKFAYTYNERLRNQLASTIDLLNADYGTRQAVITIYEGSLDAPNRLGVKRVPCSMYYQFLVRGGKLNVIYTMRSSDFMLHWPYDIWMAAQLRDYIAQNLDIETGDLIFFSGSLHAYAKDIPETF